MNLKIETIMKKYIVEAELCDSKIPGFKVRIAGFETERQAKLYIEHIDGKRLKNPKLIIKDE